MNLPRSTFYYRMAAKAEGLTDTDLTAIIEDIQDELPFYGCLSRADLLADHLSDRAQFTARDLVLEGSHCMVGDLQYSPGRSLFVRLTGPKTRPGAAGKFTDSATGDLDDLLDINRERTGITRFSELLVQARAHLGRLQPALSDMHCRGLPNHLAAHQKRPRACSRPQCLWQARCPRFTCAPERFVQAVPSGTRRFQPQCWYRDEGQTKHVERPALIMQVAFKRDWTKHAKAAPFKRNNAMMGVLPVGVLVFPGDGIQENLVEKANKLGILVLKLHKGA